jgi:hypothetical protein
VAIMRGEGDAGRAALDTLSRELPDDSTKALRIGALAASFGRVHPMLAAIDAYGASQGWSAERRTYAQHRPYAMLGVPLASMAEDERRYGQSIPGDTLCAAGRPRCRSTELFFTIAYQPRVPRAWSPYNSRGAAGIRFFGSYVIWLRDTSYARTMARVLDSLAMASRRSGNDDLAIPLHASEVYLALDDSVNALRATRTFTDSTLTVLARISTSNDAWEWPFLLAPRMMKQRGELAARMGYPEEARAWYERLLRLWADADPEFKPEVDRVRAALAATATRR